MEAAVIARDLGKAFGGSEALRGVSFDLRPGECLGVLGPPGAGKSTLLALVAGRHRPDRGQLKVLGLDARGHARTLRRLVGSLPAADSLDDELSALLGLATFGRLHGLTHREARSRAEELLAFVDLARRSHELPEALGADGRRRLLLARALIHRPALLLADEPGRGLAPEAQRALWSRLKALQRQGLSCLVASHDPHEASLLCDRLVVLDRGRALAEGSAGELIARHAGGEVLELGPLEGGAGEGLEAFLSQALPAGARVERLGARVLCFSPVGAMFPGALLERAHRAGLAVSTRKASLSDALRALSAREARC
jgi:lipooligosaccharide transport system ATP-binding protein